jgi:hypothetical protein
MHWKTIQHMNKFKCIGAILLVFLSFNVFAQTNNIYILWDVTWSMHGLVGQNAAGKLEFDDSLDIWDQTKNAISQTIENLPLDGSYNVKIIPFEDPNDPTGFIHTIKEIKSLDKIEQKELISWIMKYSGSDSSQRRGTNVCQALENVYQDLKGKKFASNNSIFLFSDGGQSARNSGWNNDTCLNNQLDKFCEIYCKYSNQQETNHLYLLKLKYVDSNINCPNCVTVGEPIGGCVFTKQVILNPTPSSHTISYSVLKAAGNLTIPCNSLGVSLPGDFSLIATSSNPRVNFTFNSFLSGNNTIILDINLLDIEEGSEETTLITFKGSTTESCYNFTVEPFNFTVKRQVISEISIGDIKPIKE